jgi:sugar lactone lactonase YvrE
LPELQVVTDNVVFGESPRWLRGRLWFADWARGQVISIDPEHPTDHEVIVDLGRPTFPMCFDFLPGGELLVVSSPTRKLVRRAGRGALFAYADLAPLSEKPWNDIVVDGRGHVYVNNIGFDFPGGDFAPGSVALATPDGRVRPVASGLAFPNGMAVTADNSTLIVAESYAEQLTAFDIAADGTLSGRRVWAATPGEHPDGICMDTTGAVWLADVGRRHCLRVREGGEVLTTVELDRGAFACTLSRKGDPTLFVTAQDWGGPDAVGGATGQVMAFLAPAPGAGRP